MNGLDDAGVVSRVQDVPFQRKTSGAPLARPTATTVDGDSATTSVSWPPPAIVGVATRRHAVPSKCATYGCASLAFQDDPTAHTSLGVRASTPAKAVLPVAGSVVDTQLVPFHRSVSGTNGALWMSLLAEPTAQASASPVASTAASCSYAATVGAAETRQVPSARRRISFRRLIDEFGSTYVPTAHTVPPAAATPLRWLKPPGLPFGVGSRVQVVPFQWAA